MKKIKLTKTYIERIEKELKLSEIRLSKQLSYSSDLRNEELIRNLKFNINNLKEMLIEGSVTV